MPAVAHIRSLLQRGDRRTVGHVAEVVNRVFAEPSLISTLVECLDDANPAARMRAADALEKVSRQQASGLQPYASVLLASLEASEQQELRWHLAVILPRLRLNATECRRTRLALQRCLTAQSSIVRTSALQGLADLTAQDATLFPQVLDLLRTAERTGTPAMKARSRRLLALWERRTPTSRLKADST